MTQTLWLWWNWVYRHFHSPASTWSVLCLTPRNRSTATSSSRQEGQVLSTWTSVYWHRERYGRPGWGTGPPQHQYLECQAMNIPARSRSCPMGVFYIQIDQMGWSTSTVLGLLCNSPSLTQMLQSSYIRPPEVQIMWLIPPLDRAAKMLPESPTYMAEYALDAEISQNRQYHHSGLQKWSLDHIWCWVDPLFAYVCCKHAPETSMVETGQKFRSRITYMLFSLFICICLLIWCHIWLLLASPIRTVPICPWTDQRIRSYKNTQKILHIFKKISKISLIYSLSGSWAWSYSPGAHRGSPHVPWIIINKMAPEDVLKLCLAYVTMVRREMPIDFKISNTIYCCTHNPQNHSTLKHIDIRVNFIRHCVSAGLIDVVHIPGSDMVADLLTKPLAAPMHERWIKLLHMEIQKRHEKDWLSRVLFVMTHGGVLDIWASTNVLGVNGVKWGQAGSDGLGRLYSQPSI